MIVYTVEEQSSILYTILHSISALPRCILPCILSLLFHTVLYLSFYSYSPLLYTILYTISTLTYCTLSYPYPSILYTILRLSLFFHNECTIVESRNRTKGRVQYGRVGIECMVVYTVEEQR
jgi:hypothetical protein